MKRRIVDLHMHIVPGVDDGARTIAESVEMLRLSAKQGITDVFCTSHNGYSIEDGEIYKRNLDILNQRVKEEGVSVKLHKGCEVLCAGDYIDDIIYGLDIGAFSTLGNSKYVLAELYPDTRPSEANFIVNSLFKRGYKPIIAHMERNYNITGVMVKTLVMSGALVQVNLSSLVQEKDIDLKIRARELLCNEYVHFIGSDSHRIDHRPPDITLGLKYIFENTNEKYAEKILCENAYSLIGI